MPKVSQKRQVTLPIEHCEIAGIEAGDEYESFVSRKGVISIVTKKRGAAKGALKGIAVNNKFDDDKSLESALSQ